MTCPEEHTRDFVDVFPAISATQYVFDLLRNHLLLFVEHACKWHLIWTGAALEVVSSGHVGLAGGQLVMGNGHNCEKIAASWAD